MSVDLEINELSSQFWTWRAEQQPRSHDDIPRIERPSNWTPEWSAADIAHYREKLSEFEAKWATIEVGQHEAPKVSIQAWVDHRALGSAISRVRWELDVLSIWQTQARFYIDQTIGVIFDYLTPLQIDGTVIENVRRILRSFDATLTHAKENLSGHAYKELAETTIKDLSLIKEQMQEMAAGLLKFIPSTEHKNFQDEVSKASDSIVSFRIWLDENLATFPEIQFVGHAKFNWFLQNVALNPLTIEQIIEIGNLEFERAIFLETITKNRYRKLTYSPLPTSAIEQSADEATKEAQVRNFYEAEKLLSQPNTLKSYHNAPRPDYLEPIKWLGVTDDLTGPSRLDVDGISYVPEPKPEMPYFYAANARDPRAGIVHEGAHYKQLALSWRNPRPVRRFYYDSGVNEGIAFYNEEMMLAAGLFQDAPHSQTLMYNFMRLRALRVIIDASLASGLMSIDTATQYLVEKVPMDEATAREEATFFAGFPGQGMTYQIGKTQIIKLMSDAIRIKRENFSIQDFHDYLWINGNLPISLLRLDLLEDWNEILIVDRITENRIKDQLWSNVRAMFDAFLTKNRPLANSYIAEDVTLWDSVERDLVVTLEGLNQLRDRRPAPSPSSPQVIAIENFNPHISIHGNLAIVRYEFLVRFDQEIPDELIRNTAVWRHQGGAWQVIHNHEDVLPNP